MTDEWLAPIDPNDVPDGYKHDPEAIESWRVWCEYWNGLTIEKRRAELRMMDHHGANGSES